MSETWLPAPQSEGYEVSSLGRVRNARTGRVLAATPHGDYRKFTIYAGRKYLPRQVHRLVCEAFHGPKPFPKAVVRHLDGDPLNNRADNLAWGTVQDNTDDKARHGRVLRGERAPRAKLTAPQVLEIRALWEQGGVSMLGLGRKYGVSDTSIHAILTRKSWAHV